MDNISSSLFGEPKYNVGDVVQISQTSKSKYKDALGIVLGYCKGQYTTICKVKLWRNKIIKIFDENLLPVKNIGKTEVSK